MWSVSRFSGSRPAELHHGFIDRTELKPTGTCPELSELINLHRQVSVPIGSAAEHWLALGPKDVC
jgi:hypothetical protein